MKLFHCYSLASLIFNKSFSSHFQKLLTCISHFLTFVSLMPWMSEDGWIIWVACCGDAWSLHWDLASLSLQEVFGAETPLQYLNNRAFPAFRKPILTAATALNPLSFSPWRFNQSLSSAGLSEGVQKLP